MLDVRDVTKYDRSLSELEEFILFCFLNHGKNAEMQIQKLDSFLKSTRSLAKDASLTPFECVRFLIDCDLLEIYTRKAKLGQYKYVVDPGFREIVTCGIDLRACSCEDLEKIKGLSFKSSRYFILHSRPSQKLAVLDRHILKYLREIGHESAPKNAPQNYKQYRYWEGIFLKECEKRNVDPANFDLEIWKSKQQRFEHA